MPEQAYSSKHRARAPSPATPLMVFRTGEQGLRAAPAPLVRTPARDAFGLAPITQGEREYA
eukprot:575384-Prorocentrum_minimum.AAC.1